MMLAGLIEQDHRGALALMLADGIASVSRGASIDGGAPAAVVLSDVRN
jgi:hypothetical protein